MLCLLSSDPGVNYERTEIREQVNAALAKLSPEHRAVVVLKELEDLHYHEIAEVLNLSMGTVMPRLFYARKKLQFMLRPNRMSSAATSGFHPCRPIENVDLSLNPRRPLQKQ